MDFETIPLHDAEKWDAALAPFGGGDVYYRRGYLATLRNRREGEPVLIHSRDGDVTACHVTLVRGLESGGTDLVSPYGYSGPILSNKSVGAAKIFLLAWESAAREMKAVSEFVRFHPILRTHEPFESLMDAPKVSQTVAMDLSVTNLEGDMSETCRKNLKVARKKGVQVGFHDSREMGRFAGLYRGTMERRGAHGYYIFEDEYFNELAKGLGGNLWVVLATHEGADVAGALVLRHDPFLHYHLGGSDYEHRSLCATNLILLSVAERGREMGLKTFHLGGGLAPGDSLFKFKAGFSSVRCDFHIGRRIYDRAQYESLSAARRKQGPIENYFPAYRSPMSR